MNSTNMTTCVMNFEISKTMRMVVFSLVVSAGLPLNCMAAWVLFFQFRMKNVLSIYMINMVTADLLQIFTVPFWIHYTYMGHRWELGREACKMVGFFFTTNFYAKIAFLCLIARERYFHIVFPMHYRGLGTVSNALKTSLLAWVVTIFFCSLGSYFISEHQDTKLCYEGYPLSKRYVLFKMTTMAFSFFIPIGLITFFYVRILYKIRKMRNLEGKKQVSGCILLTMVTFFMVLGPYQLNSFHKNFFESGKREFSDLCRTENELFLQSEITLCLMTLGNILDPLLYILLLKVMQNEFTVLCKCLCPQQGLMSQEIFISTISN